MSRLFGRVCTVLIGKGSDALELKTPLRFEFKAVKSLIKDPNSLELTISNLSKRSQGFMQGKGVDIVVQAGFPGADGIIYSGQVRTVDHVSTKGGGWNSKVKCGDTSGVTGASPQSSPVVSEAYGPGTAVVDVARSIAGKLGVGGGNLEEALGAVKGAQYATGYVAFGHPARELERVLATLNLSHSVQDGQLLVLGPSEVAKHYELVELTPETGLLGSPELGTPEEKGGPPVMKARCLLQPKLKPGCQLSIQARTVKGLFRVQKVTHHGDTRGEKWETEVEASRIK